MKRKQSMRKKWMRLLIILSLAVALLIIVSCKPNVKNPPTPATNPTSAPTEAPTKAPVPQTSTEEPTPVEVTPTPTLTPTPEPVDYSLVKPNEIGEIPIVMFHNFVENLDDTTDQEYTTSFGAFAELLETLYAQDYRLISMRDFIDHNISVPAGKIPMVFTFDDGSAGQFNLIEENGKLVINPKSAVGIMLEFQKKHPDFGLKGIFYLNMDKELKTFEGAGTLEERLKILLDLGFEVGNHSWGHFNFSNATDKAQVQEKLGKNEKRLEEVLSGMKFYSLALPFGGKVPEGLGDAMLKGEFEGVSYQNETIMAVGYLPSVPSIHTEYNPSYVRRIRSSGKIEVQFDLGYWLPLMTRDRMYISDGNPNTVVVPKSKESKVDTGKLNGKNLITY